MTRDYEQTIRELRDPQYVYHYSRDYLKNMMDDAADTIEELLPSAEVEPVKHGKWIEDNDPNADPLFRRGWKCSVCGSRTSYGTPPYCMRCGARMTEGSEK